MIHVHDVWQGPLIFFVKLTIFTYILVSTIINYVKGIKIDSLIESNSADPSSLVRQNIPTYTFQSIMGS